MINTAKRDSREEGGEEEKDNHLKIFFLCFSEVEGEVGGEEQDLRKARILSTA